MAHQDDAGLLSVKHRSRRRVTAIVYPFGVRLGVIALEAIQNRGTDRWNHARRGYGSELTSSGGRVWILCSGGNS